MAKNEITRTTLRAIMNDMIELADNETIPTVKEIQNIKNIDALFDFLKQNYKPREYWLSGSAEEDLKRLSTQILGVQYDEFAHKIGITKNGILPIIASLAMYMELGFVD